MRQPNDKLIDGGMRDYVVTMLRGQGRDFSKCEQCGKALDGKYHLHHTKYDGATLQDILIVCPKCNTSRENKGLL